MMQNKIIKKINLLIDESTFIQVFSILFTILIIIAISLASYYLARIIINRLTHVFLKKIKNDFLSLIIENDNFYILAHLVAALVLWTGSKFITHHDNIYGVNLAIIIAKLSLLYLFLTIVIIITKLIQTLNLYYEHKFDISQEKPIDSYLNVVVFFIWVISIILIIAYFVNTSPVTLITGLGAVSAIFLLIFKDTLLGIIASIQSSILNIVKKGDKISIQKHNLKGIILDISVSTVRIKNDDNTVTSIPTFMLTSEIVKNWRTIEQYGARRIGRAIHIDINSIKVCDKNLLRVLSEFEVITKFLQLSNFKEVINLTLYRVYLENYLKHHPNITQNYDIIIRHLESGPNIGLPLEVVAYTDKTLLIDYELVQAEIFEHFFAILQLFELKVFQKI